MRSPDFPRDGSRRSRQSRPRSRHQIAEFEQVDGDPKNSSKILDLALKIPRDRALARCSRLVGSARSRRNPTSGVGSRPGVIDYNQFVYVLGVADLPFGKEE